MADRSTVNLLAAMSKRFGCVAAVDYRDPVGSANKCPIDRVRITPVHHAHAPHLNIVGLDVAAYGGRQKDPLRALPTHADDYKLGTTWAYLIDLLDEQGKVVFRIHYTDAAATPPHGLASASVIAERDVDVAIACVPGFEQSDDYPAGLIENQRARYVFAAHWEDFFQPRQEILSPLRQVLDAPAIERFIDVVDAQLPRSRGVVPLNKGAACSRAKPCGPHGQAWALPVPGETFHFQTSKGVERVSTR
ncbi:MAG: hypothetical protein K1X64_04320 [Myxococcaceae bacterium]|nr:hypothetical protein [Myxococcaceae bacterium]